MPGNISGPKGLDVIFKLLDHDAAGLLEFHVIGKVAMRGRQPHPRLICHGTYERDEFAGMVAKAEPHLGAVFSIWDETYCHTLTELWSVGLPALVFDFPTVANRVRATGGGWVLPHATSLRSMRRSFASPSIPTSSFGPMTPCSPGRPGRARARRRGGWRRSTWGSTVPRWRSAAARRHPRAEGRPALRGSCG